MILLNMLGWARPARMAANSSRVASTDLSIFWSASLRMSLITAYSLCPGVDGAASADQRADLLTCDDLRDRALLLGAEDDQRQLVLHAQGEGRRVGGFQVLHQHVLIADRVELRRG